MSSLILVRHGQSLWNQANIFTGWVNVPLSRKGREEAVQTGISLSNEPIDVVFTSTLVRAHQTTMLILNEHHSHAIPILDSEDPIIHDWSGIYSDAAKANTLPVHMDLRLNERYYGDLQGLNKDDARQEFGEEQIKIWRRSFDIPPPNGESLKMTAERTLPCFKERILPQLEQNKNVLVSAHGNSLRSIIMHIEGMTPEEILEFEIATGEPRHYHYKDGKFQYLEKNSD